MWGLTELLCPNEITNVPTQVDTPYVNGSTHITEYVYVFIKFQSGHSTTITIPITSSHSMCITAF